jgi:hypothetical protein
MFCDVTMSHLIIRKPKADPYGGVKMKTKTSHLPLIGCSLFVKFILIGPSLTVSTK